MQIILELPIIIIIVIYIYKKEREKKQKSTLQSTKNRQPFLFTLLYLSQIKI